MLTTVVLTGVAMLTTRVHARAPLSARVLQIQSEPLQLRASEGQGMNLVLTYHPRGQNPKNWTTKFEIMRAPGKDHVTKARTDLASALAHQGKDRYAGALLLTTRSGKSVFLDQYRSAEDAIESILTRYFPADDGLVIYRWTKKYPLSRAPADATSRHLEVMRFIERERQKRADLITDFATKKDIPQMIKDDPMGMKTLSARPKSTP